MMHEGFRFEPTSVRRDSIPRTRVVRRLNGRFTHRLTTIVGAAGYGKSTALALAAANNHLDPHGRDVWINAVPADRDPVHLLNGIAAALDVAPTGHDTIEKIADAIWSAAPEDIAVILDDAHHIGEDAAAELTKLLSSMPTNGHLVLASRHRVRLPVARLRAHGALLEITENDLALDDEEIRALLDRDRTHRLSTADLPRHVATADLQMAAGFDASADFLWEEILSALEPDRLLHLRRVAMLDELDDDLVVAFTDGAFTASALLRGIPLVDRVGERGVRMHAILREALVARLEPSEQRKTLAVAGDAEQARHRFHVAAQLYHRAGDDIAAMDAAREYVLTPIVSQSVDATLSTRSVVDQIDPSSPVAHALEAISRFGRLEHQLIPLFEAAAESARERGDDDLEVAALNRIMQALLLDHRSGYVELVERTEELAKTSRQARGVAAHLRSIIAQLEGDADRAILEIDGLGGLDPAREYVTKASRWCDLGRPEEVAVGLAPEEITKLPPGADLFVGLAMWQRGAVEPSLAHAIGTDMVQSVLRRGFTHPTVSTLATTALAALTAGETAIAQQRVGHAVELSSVGVGAAIYDLVTVARAAVAAVREGDQAAGVILAESGDRFWHRWPSRGRLLSVPMVYVCDPESRALFEQCTFGPCISTAVRAGAAIVALRERDDVTEAAALPWSQVDLLRAHVLPTHLVELACGALAAGNPMAGAVLDSIPNLAALLHRAAEVSGPQVAAIASQRLGVIPRIQPFALHACVLGTVELYRDGELVELESFTKRPKVRELFALLLERESLSRHEICALLWPGHDDDDKALASLRTALSTLNDVLEPGRARGASAFHVILDGDTVALDRRITTDLAEFEELLASAQADDNAGLPARALGTYRKAAALCRGPYVQGTEASWIVLSRVRLQTLASVVTCRIAELTAAKGEPEEAARWAASARQIDPLNERAGRIFVAAIEASGDRTAARIAATELADALRAADLEPTAATRRLLARLL